MPDNGLTIATVLGGLGLFFFALQFLSQNLKLLASHRLRQRIARMTTTPPAGMAVGAVMILVTQSGAASVFLLVGLVRAGMLTLRQAQPIILGISVGAGIAVLFLTIDVKIAVMLVLGLSGVLYAYARVSVARLASVAVGVSLLFLGLQIMREAAAGFETQDWFQSAIVLIQDQPLLAFGIGAVLSILAQSSVAVVVVMIAFQRAGLFGLSEAIMFVYGANVGSSVLTYILASSLTGAARQVALYLVWFNFVAALVLVPLFYAETWFGMPLVATLATAISSDAGTQAAVVYLIFNIAPVPVLLLFLARTAGLLERANPQSAIEEAAKPKFLVGALPDEPGIALRLIELEQSRQLALLSSAVDTMRPEGRETAREEAFESFDSLGSAIADAVDAVTMQNLDAESYEILDVILTLQHSMRAARDTLRGLGAEISHLRGNAPELMFSDAVVEGIDTILHVLREVARDGLEHDRELLQIMTSDEGNGTKSVRAAYLSGEERVATDDRIHLLAAANYCERLIWLFGETGRSYAALNRLNTWQAR